MPHIGNALQAYFERHRTYQAALARAINRKPKTLYQYKKNHSMQAAILWELSHALKHNFFADIASELPTTFTRNSEAIPPDNEAQIANLEAELSRLQIQNDLLLKIIQDKK